MEEVYAELDERARKPRGVFKSIGLLLFCGVFYCGLAAMALMALATFFGGMEFIGGFFRGLFDGFFR